MVTLITLWRKIVKTTKKEQLKWPVQLGTKIPFFCTPNSIGAYFILRFGIHGVTSFPDILNLAKDWGKNTYVFVSANGYIIFILWKERYNWFCETPLQAWRHYSFPVPIFRNIWVNESVMWSVMNWHCYSFQVTW